MSSFTIRACPSCGCNEGETAVTPDGLRAEDATDKQLAEHWAGFFKEKTFFSYRRCAKCGLLYCPVFPAGEQLQTLYGCMADNTAGIPVAMSTKTQRGYFDLLRRWSDLTGDYLEVGPDIGLFTRFCVEEGHFSKFWLYEPNREAHAVLGAKLDRAAFEISREMFSYDAVPSAQVHVAVMIHVLDHLLDPVSVLKQLRRTLTPGARLLVVTHDESSVLAKVAGRSWPAYCLQHPQVFRPQSITRLLREAGFEVLKITKTSNHFPVGFLLRHFFWLFKSRFPPLALLERMPVALKLGNMATIASPAAER